MAAAALVALSEVRAEGLTTAMADDATVTAAILLASEVAEQVCGTRFSPVSYTKASPLLLDGTGHDTLWLPLPAVSVSEVGTVSAAGVKTAYLASQWILYSGRAPQADGRQNPRLVRRNWEAWPEGQQNIYVAGAFGWTDLADDPADLVPPINQIERAPLLVRRAVLLMVVNDFAWRLTAEDRQTERLRRWIVSETTEGHSYQLARAAVSSGHTGLREADRMLAGYVFRPYQVEA
jgi:hypothetical protein